MFRKTSRAVPAPIAMGRSFLEGSSISFLFPEGSSKREKEEPAHSLAANSHPSQKLHITLSDVVKLSETVTCVE